MSMMRASGAHDFVPTATLLTLSALVVLCAAGTGGPPPVWTTQWSFPPPNSSKTLAPHDTPCLHARCYRNLILYTPHAMLWVESSGAADRVEVVAVSTAVPAGAASGPSSSTATASLAINETATPELAVLWRGNYTDFADCRLLENHEFASNAQTWIKQIDAGTFAVLCFGTLKVFSLRSGALLWAFKLNIYDSQLALTYDRVTRNVCVGAPSWKPMTSSVRCIPLFGAQADMRTYSCAALTADSSQGSLPPALFTVAGDTGIATLICEHDYVATFDLATGAQIGNFTSSNFTFAAALKVAMTQNNSAFAFPMPRTNNAVFGVWDCVLGCVTSTIDTSAVTHLPYWDMWQTLLYEESAASLVFAARNDTATYAFRAPRRRTCMALAANGGMPPGRAAEGGVLWHAPQPVKWSMFTLMDSQPNFLQFDQAGGTLSSTSIITGENVWNYRLPNNTAPGHFFACEFSAASLVFAASTHVVWLRPSDGALVWKTDTLGKLFGPTRMYVEDSRVKFLRSLYGPASNMTMHMFSVSVVPDAGTGNDGPMLLVVATTVACIVVLIAGAAVVRYRNRQRGIDVTPKDVADGEGAALAVNAGDGPDSANAAFRDLQQPFATCDELSTVTGGSRSMSLTGGIAPSLPPPKPSSGVFAAGSGVLAALPARSKTSPRQPPRRTPPQHQAILFDYE
jgi:hypothetical protein